MTAKKEQRLERALDFITENYRTHRSGCTVRAILAHFDGEVTSTNTIAKWLDELEARGEIVHTPGLAGAIIPANDPLLEEVLFLRERVAELEAQG